MASDGPTDAWLQTQEYLPPTPGIHEPGNVQQITLSL